MIGQQHASAKHALNRLLNGGVYRVLLPFKETETYAVGTGVVPVSTLESREDDAASPSLRVVAARPTETLLAGWYAYGVSGLIDIRPKDPLLSNVPVRGFHGPSPARFTHFEDGTMVFEQPIEEFWSLLDRELTLSFIGIEGANVGTVTVEMVYGNSTVVLKQFSTRTFGRAGAQVVLHFSAPYDASSFMLRLKIEGKRDLSVYMGEFMLQLGNVANPRFTDDISLLGRPRGTSIFFAGSAIPPGFVVECEGLGRLVYPAGADPRVNGNDRGALGGDEAHKHGGKTSGRTFDTTVHKTGVSRLDKNHRHAIEDATTDPPYVQLVVLRKV